MFTLYGPARVVGTMFDDVKVRKVIKSTDEETQKKYLLKFFQAIFDQAGYDRPASLNRFP